jgi:hypothetical protein
MYKDAAETIIGNMDSRIFLGGAEKTTLKDLSESLGKETIYLLNNSESRGNSPSYSRNYQKLGKDVLSCKGVKSNTPILQGSSFICGTFGRTPKRKNYLPAREQFALSYAVIKCAEKFFEKLFKKCSDLPPVFLLYIEGCNLNIAAQGYVNHTRKGGCSAIFSIPNTNLIKERGQHHETHCNQFQRQCG